MLLLVLDGEIPFQLPFVKHMKYTLPAWMEGARLG